MPQEPAGRGPALPHTSPESAGVGARRPPLPFASRLDPETPRRVIPWISSARMGDSPIR
jgi:hypothetical protein